MGVLEKEKRTSNEYKLGSCIEVTKEELLNELIYLEVLNNLDIKHNIFNFIELKDNNCFVLTESSNIEDSKIISLKKFIDYEVEDVNFSLSNSYRREKRTDAYYTSLENVETSFRLLYPRYINYNSSRKILNDLSKIVAVDYLLACSNRKLSEICINEYKDQVFGYGFELNSIGLSTKLFDELAGITPLIKTIMKYDTFDRSLVKALDEQGKNYSTTKFLKYLEEYSDVVTTSLFLEIINKVNEENKLNIDNNVIVNNYLNNYNKQRSLIKKSYQINKIR